jgi:guanine deaminase
VKRYGLAMLMKTRETRMKGDSIAYRGRIIESKGPYEISDVADGMLVAQGGRVVSCGKYDRAYKGKVVEFKDRVIIPGLVDMHSHIPQLDERGKHGATLLDWLERYIFPAERAFEDEKKAEDVASRFFKKLILNGTTCAGLYSTVHEAATTRCFEVAKASGVRCFIGKVMMDCNSPTGLLETTKDSLARSERLCTKWHGACGGRLRYAFTPRFAPTCTIELFRGVARLADESGAYVQSHIAETIGENDRVREMYPKYKDYIELFEDACLMGPKTILAHAIYLSDGEYRRMAKSGTRIAHCPTSNFFLKSGWMPTAKVEEAGVVYGLGTDVGAGTSMSVFTEMRHADYTQLGSAITPPKAFYLATLGGARAMSMDGVIGNFDAGKSADFAVVDICGIDPRYNLSRLTTDEVLSLIMYRGDGRMIEATYVEGEKLDVDFA